LDADITNDLKTSVWYYKSKEFLGIMCVPDMKFLESYLNNGDMNKYLDTASAGIEDIKKSWEVILGSVFLCLFVAFLYTFLMKWLSGIIIWLLILVIFVLEITLGALFY